MYTKYFLLCFGLVGNRSILSCDRLTSLAQGQSCFPVPVGEPCVIGVDVSCSGDFCVDFYQALAIH